MSFPVFQDTLFFARPADSIRVERPRLKSDSIIFALPRETRQRTLTTPKKQIVEEIDLVQQAPVPARDTFITKWNTDSFMVNNPLKGIVSNNTENNNTSVLYGTTRPGENMVPVPREPVTYDWMLGIFLFLVVLFVWIRVFYSKFFNALANALVSFQLSVKLFEERNVLQRRVSMVLDFIYVIVTTVFVFEIIEYTGFAGTGMTGIDLFLLLLNILMLYSILRIIILRMTGSLFMVTPLFSEYIHNTFVVNKGLGILLFPVIIMAHYMPYKLIPVMLISGIVLYGTAILYKSFRAYQIIIRRDILIFYLILYLCTLEILPLLLGYKFVTSLIQSN